MCFHIQESASLFREVKSSPIPSPKLTFCPLRIKGLEDEMIPFGARPMGPFSGANCQTVSFREFEFHPRKKNLRIPSKCCPWDLRICRPCRFPWRSDRAKKRRKDRSRKRHRDRERPRDLEKEAVWAVGSIFFGGSNLMLTRMVIV